MIQQLINPIAGVVNNVINKFVMDKDLSAKIQAEVTHHLIDSNNSQIDNAVKVILAEAQGKSWMQRNWRPLLMMTIVAIVANNFLIFPYLSMLGIKAAHLELPSSLYNLMTIGVGGYIAGRSGEKMIKTWKGPNNG